jgi:hypothetical protein
LGFYLVVAKARLSSTTHPLVLSSNSTKYQVYLPSSHLSLVLGAKLTVPLTFQALKSPALSPQGVLRKLTPEYPSSPLINVLTYLPFWVVGIRVVALVAVGELDDTELETELDTLLELVATDATEEELTEVLVATELEIDELDEPVSLVGLFALAVWKSGEKTSHHRNNITPRRAIIHQKNLFRKVSVFCIRITKSLSLKIFELK